MTIPIAAVAAGEIAALTASAGLLSAIFGFALKEHRTEGEQRALVVASGSGALLAILALTFDSQPLRDAALAWVVVVVGSILVLALAEAVPAGPLDLWWRAADWLEQRRSSVLFGVGLGLVAAGVAVGALLFGSGTTTTVTPSGRYRVHGTCVNGACTVNECATPAVCGNQNKGELAEGTAVEIECQTAGGNAKAPNGHRSKIWDRLTTGVYVSDLFVKGTEDGRFAPGLGRCSGG